MAIKRRRYRHRCLFHLNDDFPGGHCRVCGVVDRTTHYKVVGAVANCIGWCAKAPMVVCRHSWRPYARSCHEKVLPLAFRNVFQPLNVVGWRHDYTVATRIKSFFGIGGNIPSNGPIDNPHGAKIFFVENCQQGHHEDFNAGVSAPLYSRPDNLLIVMHRYKADLPARGGADSPFNCVFDACTVLCVNENLLPCINEALDKGVCPFKLSKGGNRS